MSNVQGASSGRRAGAGQSSRWTSALPGLDPDEWQPERLCGVPLDGAAILADALVLGGGIGVDLGEVLAGGATDARVHGGMIVAGDLPRDSLDVSVSLSSRPWPI